MDAMDQSIVSVSDQRRAAADDESLGDDSTADDYEDTLLELGNDVEELDDTLRAPEKSASLQTSTEAQKSSSLEVPLTNTSPDKSVSLQGSSFPMADSRSSSGGTGAEWEDPWLRSAANSESGLVSAAGSSSGTSPLTGTSSQGVSPSADAMLSETFHFDAGEGKNQSLSSISDALQTEKDFMEYVMSFPTTAASPLNAGNAEVKRTASDTNRKVGLDHLDNLCKLMEQLSDLKETNVKLKRRVQYLEDVKTLHEIHKEMAGESTHGTANTLSEDELQQQQKPVEFPKYESPKKTSSSSAAGQEPKVGVHRSKTAANVDGKQESSFGLHKSRTATAIDSGQEMKIGVHKSRTTTAISGGSQDRLRERSKSVGHPALSKAGKKRSSRWSKVKEALGIDKLEGANGVHPHHDDRGREAIYDERRDVNASDTELLKYSDDAVRKMSGGKNGKSLSNSQPEGLLRPRTIVLSSSSFSKVQEQSQVSKPAEQKSKTLDCPKAAQRVLARLEKEEGQKKSPKTPWGRVKTMIQTRRDSRHHKSESSSSSSRGNKDKGDNGIPVDHYYNGSHHQRRSSRGQRGIAQEEWKFPLEDFSVPQREYVEVINDGAWKDSSLEMPDHHPQQAKQAAKDGGKRKKPKPRPLSLVPDAQDDVREENRCSATEEERDTPKTPGSSPQMHRKWVWTRVKDVLTRRRDDGVRLSRSVPSSPASIVDGVAFDFQDLNGPGDPLGDQNVSHSYPESSSLMMRAGSPREESLGLSPSSTVSELLRELQNNLSNDFNKKLEEWERFRAEGGKIPSPAVQRKDSFGKLRKISKTEKKIPLVEKVPKHKDISWLDKELQKIQREILRLSKEKQKFEKRVFRLQRLKDAMTDPHKKKEVLVRTAAGEFRFEGISDAFTKKLYEWETKQGVGPELSTIALLDECLGNKPLNSADSQSIKRDCRSATELAELSHSSSKSSPSTIHEQSGKSCFQQSRASSEPDLSILSSQKEGAIQTRSKSGDTLLTDSSSNGRSDAELAPEGRKSRSAAWEPHSRDTPQTEDNYYCLLEENMFLLEQLKGKEEICRQLQNELDRLDDRTDQTNRSHQEEMEKYRQKLWEIHMSRPRDLQGSLHLISELKTRIEELQRCSEKLKCDREALEESFRYHSEQQSRLADDLIDRMKELQEAGLPTSLDHSDFPSGSRRKCRKMIKCDPASVVRIHELSTQLLQQARDMEQALAERTRQVCHLRWELVHRDVSAVLLQAALHRVTWQGEAPAVLPTWDTKRSKFKESKAWSIDTTTRRQSQDSAAEDWLQEKLRRLTLAPYSDWTSVEYSPNDLIATVHELKKETLKMSSRSEWISDNEEGKTKTTEGSADSEMADSERYYDTGSAVNSRSSSFSSGPGGLRMSHSDARLYERSRGLFFRRNSSSSVSGVDASDSSSVHESDRITFLMRRLPWPRWRSQDNITSSSDSSLLEDEGTFHWGSGLDRDFGEEPQEEDGLCRELQLKYGSFKEADEDAEDETELTTSRASHCLITPRVIHLNGQSSQRSVGSPQAFFELLIGSTNKPSTNVNPSAELHRDVSFLQGNPTVETRIQEDGEVAVDQRTHSDESVTTRDNSEIVSLKDTPAMVEFSWGEHCREKDCSSDSEILLCNHVTSESAVNDTGINKGIENLPNVETTAQDYGIKSPETLDITTLKYKGTKGFGKPLKSEFRTEMARNKSTTRTVTSASGVKVASDRSPDQRSSSFGAVPHSPISSNATTMRSPLETASLLKTVDGEWLPKNNVMSEHVTAQATGVPKQENNPSQKLLISSKSSCKQ